MRGSVLVMAKAPVAGQAKTRLAAVVGPRAAADLAAAALLDTLEAGAAAYPPERRVLALTGDLATAARADDLRRAARDWIVVRQGGLTFADRLVDGHREAHRLAGGPVVQIGMDTPQVPAALLRTVAELAHGRRRPVLGAAVDGGWWVLVTTQAQQAAVLTGVPMSTPETGRLTAAALAEVGAAPAPAPVLRDVDEVEDAHVVAAEAPGTRFAQRWRDLVGTGGLEMGESGSSLSTSGRSRPAAAGRGEEGP